MTRALLDVNVLLALLDGDHVDHDRATTGSTPRSREGGRHARSPRTASCGSSASPATRAREIVDGSRLHGPRQVTDAYLLALATARGGRFVTFDRSLSLAAVHGAAEEHLTVL